MLRMTLGVGTRIAVHFKAIMSSREHILVIAATARELAVADGWRTLLCGVGPVEAAAATAEAVAEMRPAAILHVGIAGARRSSGLQAPAIIIGTAARYCDLTVPPQWAPRELTPSVLLLNTASALLPEATLARIGTTASVGGITGDASCDVEAMEGFAVLRAAERAGVPAIEIRAISNHIEEPDRAKWHFDEAFAAITGITPHLVDEFARCVR